MANDTTLNRHSTLARLLSQEDLEVLFTNQTTASFDMTNRVLRVPLTKGKLSSDHVYEGFVLHEIGHALYTPDLSKYKERLKNIPHSLMNVLEDVRIEKMVKEKYPGSRLSFSEFYETMFQEGFFGEKDDIINSGFLDHINVYSKCGAKTCGFLLTDYEYEVYTKAYNAKTFNQLLDVCEEVMDDVDDPQTLFQQLPECEDDEEDGAGDEDESGDSDEEDSSSGSEGNGQSSSYDEDEQNSSDGDEDESGSSEGEDEDEDEDGDFGFYDPYVGGDDEAVDTPKIDSRELIAISQQKFDEEVQKSVLQQEIKNVYLGDYVTSSKKGLGYIHWKTNAEEIKSRKEEQIERSSYLMSHRRKEDQETIKQELQTKLRSEYTTFVKNHENIVNSMVQEFNRKKAADDFQKTKVSKKGVIDPKKLKDYRTKEDIFKRTEKVPEGKNHGLIMFVDFSGSMSSANRLRNTMKQVLINVMFARRVNIPFQVYGFTNWGRRSGSHIRSRNLFQEYEVNTSDDVLKHESSQELTCLTQIFDSTTMTKKDIDEQLFENYCAAISIADGGNVGYRLGGTPLDEVIMFSEHIIRKFKDENDIQICNTMFLTDGASNPTDYKQHKGGGNSLFGEFLHKRYNSVFHDPKTNMKYFNIFKEVEGKYMLHTSFLYRVLQDRVETNLVVYFIASGKKEVSNTVNETPCQNVEHFESFTKCSFGGDEEFFILDDSSMDTSSSSSEFKGETSEEVAEDFRNKQRKKKNQQFFAKKLLDIISK